MSLSDSIGKELPRLTYYFENLLIIFKKGDLNGDGIGQWFYSTRIEFLDISMPTQFHL